MLRPPQGFCSIGCPTHRKDDILNWLLAAAWYREVYCNELLQLNTLIYLTALSSNVLPWCCFLCFPFSYMSSFLSSGLPILQIPCPVEKNVQSCWTGAERDVQCQDVDLSSAAGYQQRIQHQIKLTSFHISSVVDCHKKYSSRSPDIFRSKRSTSNQM